MPHHSRIFYLYLGIHSLLIGIFPFFIPVYLWREDYRLGEISIFIAIAGLGFCVGLWAWDRLRHRIDLSSMIALSLLLEMLLLLNVYVMNMDMTLPVLVSLGICYGVYNCFFWTTQRALFFEIIDPSNSGRRYGNFQIFVGALLQVGILLGGLLLERAGFVYIVVLSAIIALAGFMILLANKPEYPDTLKHTAPLGLRETLAFTDQDASRPIFISGRHLSFFGKLLLGDFVVSDCPSKFHQTRHHYFIAGGNFRHSVLSSQEHHRPSRQKADVSTGGDTVCPVVGAARANRRQSIARIIVHPADRHHLQHINLPPGDEQTFLRHRQTHPLASLSGAQKLLLPSRNFCSVPIVRLAGVVV